ncbi:hypothetical protein HAX54_035343 [Datura stramonium]|uniref:Uncharacterized protein n=1 Tax=Datura stramonium TaxID=4076 RepID=A0ABS8SF57_DATST|nr:hypothetical protein [Datura stramonium]
MDGSEKNSSQRHVYEGSMTQEEITRSEKSMEEEEGVRDDSSERNNDGEGEGEQMTHTAESSPPSPSSDTRLVKPIIYSHYNFETSIDRHPNLTGDIIVRPGMEKIVHLRILPTPSEMTKNFLNGFVPLEVTRDDKIKRLERDLVGVVAIKKNCRVVENDLEPSRELVDFGVVGGDATTINRVEIGEFSLTCYWWRWRIFSECWW